MQPHPATGFADQPQQQPARRAYQPPAIVYEARLEAQAGSPLGNDPLQRLFEDSLSR